VETLLLEELAPEDHGCSGATAVAKNCSCARHDSLKIRRYTVQRVTGRPISQLRITPRKMRSAITR
jgi:hypothetical protein